VRRCERIPPAPGTDDVTVATQGSSTSSRPATSPPPRRSSSTRSSCALHKPRFSHRVSEERSRARRGAEDVTRDIPTIGSSLFDEKKFGNRNSVVQLWPRLMKESRDTADYNLMTEACCSALFKNEFRFGRRLCYVTSRQDSRYKATEEHDAARRDLISREKRK